MSSKLVEKDLVAVEVLELRRALSARAGKAHLLGQQRIMLQEALEKHKLEHLVQATDLQPLHCLSHVPARNVFFSYASKCISTLHVKSHLSVKLV